MRRPVVLFLFLEAANICPEGRTVDSVVTVAALCASSSKFRTPDTALLLEEECRGKGCQGELQIARAGETEDFERPLPLFKSVSSSAASC